MHTRAWRVGLSARVCACTCALRRTCRRVLTTSMGTSTVCAVVAHVAPASPYRKYVSIGENVRDAGAPALATVAVAAMMDRNNCSG
jgi:hypothetical protein